MLPNKKLIISLLISLSLLSSINPKNDFEKLENNSQSNHPNPNALVINEDIISKINSLNTTWTAGVNSKLKNLTIKQAKNLLGFKKPPKHIIEKRFKDSLLKNQIISGPLLSAKSLPENYDLREAYPNCQTLKDIRDQSTCSSCWAHGAAESLSDRICIHSNQKYTNIRISVDDVLSCCGDDCGVGCNGGYPFSAWDYFRDHGTVTGGNYQEKGNTCRPYSFKPCDHAQKGSFGPCDFDVKTPECKRTCDPSYQKSYEEDKWFGSSSYSLYGGEEQMMNEIYEKGSIEVGYSVYEDFFTYRKGIYKHETGVYLGGHAVKCIGWGVENGVKYWLLANSWNTEWGENGFFRILRGADHAGIESSVDTGMPKLPENFNNGNVEGDLKGKEFLKYLLE